MHSLTNFQLNRQSLKEFRCDLTIKLETAIADRSITEKNLWTLAGIMNAMQWAIAERSGALEKTEDGYFANDEIVDSLVASGMKGLLEITMSTKWLKHHLERNWPLANSGLPAIRKCRAFIRDYLELYEYIDGIKSKTVTPLAFRSINFVGMLVASEVVETLLLKYHEQEYLSDCVDMDEYGFTRRKQNLELLPKHRGMNTILLFNSAFRDIAEYRRLDNLKDKTVERVGVVKALKRINTWKWKPHYELPFKSWKTMMDRAVCDRDVQIMNFWEFYSREEAEAEVASG